MLLRSSLHFRLRPRLRHAPRFLSAPLLGTVAAIAMSAQSRPAPAPGEGVVSLNKGAFAAGERLSYAVSFGRLHVGRGTMLLAGTDTIRGHTCLLYTSDAADD